MTYNGKMFYYVKNLQGDIVKILDEDGQEKADYVYNAWGDIISQSDDELASINPLRYRGYVYDEDTATCYLQSRYYDPTTGRFINADDTAFISSSGTAIGDNIFTYCENDPVNNVDYTGQWYHSLKQFKRHLDKIIIPSQYYNKKSKYDLAYGHYYFNKKIVHSFLAIFLDSMIRE
jgi:RHS repeat-associated protein